MGGGVEGRGWMIRHLRCRSHKRRFYPNHKHTPLTLYGHIKGSLYDVQFMMGLRLKVRRQRQGSDGSGDSEFIE